MVMRWKYVDGKVAKIRKCIKFSACIMIGSGWEFIWSYLSTPTKIYWDWVFFAFVILYDLWKSRSAMYDLRLSSQGHGGFKGSATYQMVHKFWRYLFGNINNKYFSSDRPKSPDYFIVIHAIDQ